MIFKIRSSDGGNRSHNVSLPIILKKTKVGQILQYSCISLLVVPILLYWIQVSVSLNVKVKPCYNLAAIFNPCNPRLSGGDCS